MPWSGRFAEPVSDLVKRYFAERYAAFDRLCRTTYDELVLDWPDPIVPWDQLLATRSRTEVSSGPFVERGCGGPSTAPIWIKTEAPARGGCETMSQPAA